MYDKKKASKQLLLSFAAETRRDEATEIRPATVNLV